VSQRRTALSEKIPAKDNGTRCGIASTALARAQNYYSFTAVAFLVLSNPKRQNHPNFLKSKRVKVVPAAGIEPTT
jgi:hypothetical protein